MKKLTRQEKHEQCIREIRGTWFSVSTLGTIVLSLLGVWYLLKKVFIDFEYEDEEEGGEE